MPGKQASVRNSGIYNASGLSATALLKLHPSMNVQRLAALPDIGPMCSVVGLATAERIARAAGHKLQMTASRLQFRFGVTTHGSLGSFEVLIPTPRMVMRLCPDVVKAEVPFLIGRDAFEQNCVQALTVEDLLQFVPLPGAATLPWFMPLSRNIGNVFLQFTPVPSAVGIFYQRAQLAKLRRSLYHSSASKFCIVLKRADACQLDANTRKVLEKTS